MPRRHWIAVLSFWPGLPQIWSGQELLGLILASMFALTVNTAVVSRYLWTDALPPGGPTFFAALAAFTWLAGLGYTLYWIGCCHPERYRVDIDRLYREAMDHYLQGRWNEARKQFEQILAFDETDADALMQLASLYVHTGQPALARKTFRQCLELEGGAKWRWEIGQSLAKLEAT
jgi:tetratricopeptide (TPR) repeat protein